MVMVMVAVVVVAVVTGNIVALNNGSRRWAAAVGKVCLTLYKSYRTPSNGKSRS